jgi:acyl-CoA thioester hydrolase
MDMLGHLNQSVYHALLEESRGDLLEPILEEGKFPFVLARIELDYKHEVRHGDRYVDVHAALGRVGDKSVTIEHEVALPDGTTAAVGRAVLVAWDPDARQARRLTTDERTALGG